MKVITNVPMLQKVLNMHIVLMVNVLVGKQKNYPNYSSILFRETFSGSATTEDPCYCNLSTSAVYYYNHDNTSTPYCINSG